MAIFLSLAGAVLDRFAGAFGLMAATMAIGGFVGRGGAILTNADEDAVQRSTIYGGFAGLLGALALVLIDAIAG